MFPLVSTSEGQFCVRKRELKPFTKSHTAGWSQTSCWWKVDVAILIGFKERPPTPDGERELGKKCEAVPTAAPGML